MCIFFSFKLDLFEELQRDAQIRKLSCLLVHFQNGPTTRDGSWVLVVPLPVQVPACGLGGKGRMSQSLETYLGDPEEPPGSWLRMSSATTAAAAPEGDGEPVDGASFSVSPSLRRSDLPFR